MTNASAPTPNAYAVRRATTERSTMPILAMPPRYFFVSSTEVSLLYLLVAALPLIIVRLRRSSGAAQKQFRFKILVAYASILIVIGPGLLRVGGHREAVIHWMIECSVIGIVSGIATLVFSRRKKLVERADSPTDQGRDQDSGRDRDVQ